MNRRIVLAVALASLFAAVVAGGCQSTGKNSPAMPPSPTPVVAADLVEQHCDALRKKDWAALERLWADELTFVNPRGQVLSKADRLQNLRAGSTSFDTLQCSEMSTKSWGRDWAVTTMRALLKGQYSGQEGTGDYRCTFVWGQPHGRWQLVGLQMTQIQR